MVGSLTDGTLEIASDLTFKEDDTVILTSGILTESVDFESTLSEQTLTIQGFSE